MLSSETPPHFSALTDVGLRRKTNEDALFADGPSGLFIVADGMGGRNGGEVAAQMVVHGLPTLLRHKLSEASELDNDTIARILFDSIQEQSWQVVDAARNNTTLTGLGATVMLAFLHDGAAWFANMGDSTSFLCRMGHIQRLTDEHNVAALMLKRGDISREEYARHPARAVLLRHIGMKATARPDIRRLRLVPGDRLVLCSDGLTSMVPDEGILEMVANAPTCEHAAHALVEASKAAGGRDNITVIVIEPSLPRTR